MTIRGVAIRCLTPQRSKRSPVLDAAGGQDTLRPSLAGSMEWYSYALSIFSMALEATLLLRARQGRFLSQFPFFYSYVTYVLGWTLVTFLLYFLMPQQYPSAFWFCYTIMLVAEFAVLLEGSDHIFKPYPAIRRLGLLLTLCIGLIFFVVYIIPPLTQHQTSRAAMLDLVKRTSLTKAVMIVILIAAARLCRLPLGKNISGMLLGFATYLSISIANFALAQRYAQGVYGSIFAVAGPLSFVLALTIWNIALWRPEPVLAAGREFSRSGDNLSEPLGIRLGRYNNELMRLFRR